MKQRKQLLPTRLMPENRFELDPLPAAPFRGGQETALENLKEQLLATARAKASSKQSFAPLEQAANEAAALAWLTPFPLLFLPPLFEELSARAFKQRALQSRILKRSRGLMKAGV